jgi:hypothetical protein
VQTAQPRMSLPRPAAEARAARPPPPPRSSWYNDNNYCAIAHRSYMYTYFFGTRRNESYTQAKFDQAGTDGPWGWYTAACGSAYNYICKIRANDYPCYPPPNPMPPPPSPPSPPIPPAKASCECPEPSGAAPARCSLLPAKAACHSAHGCPSSLC